MEGVKRQAEKCEWGEYTEVRNVVTNDCLSLTPLGVIYLTLLDRALFAPFLDGLKDTLPWF